MRTYTAVLAFCLALCCPAHAREQAVAPGQRFPGPILNITAPTSAGWRLGQSSANAMVFERPGASGGESYIAAVLSFPLPESLTDDEFVALVKSGVQKDTPPDRYKNTEATFEKSMERGYPCVLYRATAEDTKARTSLFSKAHLILQVQTLYCHPPNMQKAGFGASYSHRGTAANADFNGQAKEFIDGVQVPHG